MDSSIPAGVRLKTVALPPEHGAWGFLLEPILLGLGAAPSIAGGFLAVAVIGAFLARHPLKIAAADWRRGKRYLRTRLAERFALAYSALALLGGAAALGLAGPGIFLPLLLAIPLAVVMFAGYIQNRGRELVTELAGASAMALAVSSLALAGGKSPEIALALWGVLLARNNASILYIRARLRLEKGKPFSFATVLISNVLSTAGVLALVLAGLIPWLAILAILILFCRAIYGLSPYRRRVRTQTLGFLEMGYGLLVVLATLAGG
ncbi:MAG: YwiC-like family protein [Chloroflexi bacterium]|nr:YwiC-like family protein [Chloroflexota bacterium]